VKNISITKELPSGKELKKETGLEKIKFQSGERKLDIALKKEDKLRFLKELSISENLIKRIKGKRKNSGLEKTSEFKRSRGYLKLSNRFFLNQSIRLVKKGYFKTLALDLKRGNFEILLETYIAMMFFSSVLSIFVGFFIALFLMFFNIKFGWPIISIFNGSYLIRFLKIFWIPFIAPVLTFLILYIYPTTEKKSIGKNIEQELPFAVIHMSSISGSGIAPVQIFKIIALSREYHYISKEIRKVINQINLYGYDLSTALNNASKTSPSQKLAELFSGLATTINSGGSLKEFFDKRAESLLLQYRLEREKFSKIAETFMDIYISVVIATPMILMLILMMISITGTDIGLGPTEMSLVIIVIIALINLFFIMFLQLKQPKY